MVLDTNNPLNEFLNVSLKRDASSASAASPSGVANDGYWGIPVKPQTTYKVSFFAKAASGFTGPVTVSLESADGKTTFASADISGLTAEWKKFETQMKTKDVPASKENVYKLTKVRYQAQDGVLTALVAALGKLKSAAQGLSLAADFDKRSAVSSDTSVLTASADATAVTGANTIAVDRLATARIVKSTSFASESDTIGSGTLTITVDGKSTSITVDALNNTLTGLKNAINASGAAVTASIVNTGTSASPDYRLVVQSDETGTANALALSGTLAGGADPFAGGGIEVQAAADGLRAVEARFGGITVSAKLLE